MTAQSPSKPVDLSPRIRAMNDYARDRLDETLTALEVDLEPGGRDYCGSCPVHGGDNPTSLHLYQDGHTCKGNWFCATRGCERSFGRDLFGFVRGVLSRREHNWSGEGDAKVSLWDTLQWLADLFGVDPAQVAFGSARADGINNWTSRVGKLTRDLPRLGEAGWSREEVRSRLKIPSPYFLSRGFSAEVLDEYDVGDAPEAAAGVMAGRAVVPVYDLSGHRCVGFAGRSIAGGMPKWRNEGFASGSTLFNFWKARGEIKKRRRAVIVEGPGDCLRAVEAGITNAVCTFGVNLSDCHTIILESLGVMELDLLYDRDEAGEKAMNDVRRGVGRAFKVNVPRWRPAAGKDVGDCTAEELQPLREALNG